MISKTTFNYKKESKQMFFGEHINITQHYSKVTN